MAFKENTPKTFKTLCISGSIFLVAMALFHGSGFQFVNESILQSNAKPFLKDIVPILFVHPSIHLIGLAAFGILAMFQATKAKKTLVLLSLLIWVDAALAIYLGGIVPAILLTTSGLCYYAASHYLKQFE